MYLKRLVNGRFYDLVEQVYWIETCVGFGGEGYDYLRHWNMLLYAEFEKLLTEREDGTLVIKTDIEEHWLIDRLRRWSVSKEFGNKTKIIFEISILVQ